MICLAMAVQDGQQPRDRFDFVRFVISLDLTKGQVLGRCPRAHHIHGKLAPGLVKRVAQRLPVHGDDLTNYGRCDFLDPGNEARPEPARNQGREHASERTYLRPESRDACPIRRGSKRSRFREGIHAN